MSDNVLKLRPARDAVQEVLAEAEGAHGGVYRATSEGIVYRNEDFHSALCNFAARITSRSAIEDGATTKTMLDLEVITHRGTSRLRVSASEFLSLRWVTDCPGAVIWPGPGVRQHLLAAIQLLSEPEERRIFRHLGWREVDGDHVYLHGDGTIGRLNNACVEIEPPLDRFALPEPPRGTDLHDAIKSAAAILTLASGKLTVPLLGAVFRSVVGDCESAVHLSGPTGKGKSQLAAIAQSFFGAQMSVGAELPGSWASTANANERLAFLAKDALLVIDDWVPTTRQGTEVEMDRLLRAAGNRGGRARMTGATYWPRGLLVSTGEATPRLPSLLARMIVLRLGDDLAWDRLTAAQQNARAGLHAECMAAFIHWLAPRLDDVRAWLRERVQVGRSFFSIPGLHARSVNALSNLEAGLVLFVNFAVDSGVLDPHGADELLQVAHERLLECGRDQLEIQVAGDPARLFTTRLVNAIARGNAHLADLDGEDDGHVSGVKVGWARGEMAFLDPHQALQAARGEEGHEGLAISGRALGAALHAQGLLMRVDTRGDRVRYQVRVVLDGDTRQVWAVDRRALETVAIVARRAETTAQEVRWDEPLRART